MSTELIKQIDQAEARADELLEAANREARDMVKAAEEAFIAYERQYTREIRDESLRMIESARVATLDEIRALEIRNKTDREVKRGIASGRVPKAGAMIFERVVKNGDR